MWGAHHILLYAHQYILLHIGLSRVLLLLGNALYDTHSGIQAHLLASHNYMLTTPFSRQLSAVYRYQTLCKDEHWSDAIKEKYILESVLPDDFVLSTYYAASRDMLAQQSNNKSKPKLKKVPGCPAEEYRVKRVHEPTVDLKTLSKAQLLAEVYKQNEEITSLYQELNNFSQLKAANKKYAVDIVEAEQQAAAFSGTLDEFHKLVSEKEGLLEQAEKLTKDQADVMAGMTKAHVKDKESIAALELSRDTLATRLTEAMASHTQKQEIITEMQNTIQTLTSQAEKGGAADNYESLWRRGTKSRKLEQAATAQLQLELTEALETINRLQSEAHDTSMEDIYAGSTPIGQQQQDLDSASPGLLLSDIKSDAQAIPAAPSYSYKAAASAPPVAPVPAVPAPQGSSEGSAGAEIKEALLAQYKELGQVVMTDYSYRGERLELAGLIQCMQDIYVEFRSEITEWKSKQKPDLELQQFTEALQLLDIVGRDHMRRYISFYDTQGGPGRCGRCGISPGSMAGKHGAKGHGLQLECPHRMIACDFCKLVFSQVPDINVKMMAPDNVTELHPTGYHTKEVCPYMKAQFQYYLVSIIERITGLRPRPKAYVPFGGHGGMQNITIPVGNVQVSAVDKFSQSLGLF